MQYNILAKPGYLQGRRYMSQHEIQYRLFYQYLNVDILEYEPILDIEGWEPDFLLGNQYLCNSISGQILIEIKPFFEYSELFGCVKKIDNSNCSKYPVVLIGGFRINKQISDNKSITLENFCLYRNLEKQWSFCTAIIDDDIDTGKIRLLYKPLDGLEITGNNEKYFKPNYQITRCWNKAASEKQTKRDERIKLAS